MSATERAYADAEAGVRPLTDSGARGGIPSDVGTISVHGERLEKAIEQLIAAVSKAEDNFAPVCAREAKPIEADPQMFAGPASHLAEILSSAADRISNATDRLRRLSASSDL